MDRHTAIGYKLTKDYTTHYSTSFGLSTKLCSNAIRPHIFAIYAMVRMADEIVDTFDGSAKEKAMLLDEFQASLDNGLATGYSPNPMLQAFIQTAQRFTIDHSLIDPFFDSMRMDLEPFTATPKLYERYIFGSAEVIGLMCLKVFVNGDRAEYHELRSGAQALGSAYQKVNFLRDISSDYNDRGRMYFPAVQYDAMSEVDKAVILTDIENDFEIAKVAIPKLPSGARLAVQSSYEIYLRLLQQLRTKSVEEIKSERVRVPNPQKLLCVFKAVAKGKKA
ncbi:MAG: phytoene/squalene synthase family protein [Candidatus Saccharimonadales bacterium]